MSYADDPVTYWSNGGTQMETFGNGSTYAYTADYKAGTNVLSGFSWKPINSSSTSTSGTGNVSTVTGVNPTETQYSLYGHTIPLSVFGKGRIGGEIIAGPWIDNGLASFIISFGVPADPSGTRTLHEIAFDSEVVWDSTNGFSTESFTYRFYGGTLTQAADTLETSHFGAAAVAYRPQMLLAFENLPLANTKFRKIPYVAAVISDASGVDVNLGEAFERLAYSPWVGYTSAQFETVGITDGLVSGGMIIADQAEFLATIQQFGRFYPKWSILQTDKLRIVDRGSDVTPDVVLTRARLLDKTTLTRQEPNTVPSILDLSTIDPDADYTIVPSRAQSPRAPVAVTTSVQTDSAYLPVIMDAATRISLVTYAKHHEDRARKQISATAMLYGVELEPGDYVGIAGLGTDFPGGETFRVLETLHGANYAVEFTAESILQCSVTSLTEPPPTTGSGPIPSLTGLIGWWDASVLASMTIDAVNHNISLILDQTGNGNHLAPVAGRGGSPSYDSTGFNFRPTIQFSEAHQTSLHRASFPLGTGNTLTIFAAATLSVADVTDSTRGHLVSYTAPAASHDYDNVGSFSVRRDEQTNAIHWTRNSASSTDATLGYSQTRTIIITLKSDGTLTTYINGVAASNSMTPASFVSAGDFFIGAGKFDTSIFSGYWGGQISEVGIATAWHDATVVADLHAYLKDKWGIA